MSLYKYFKRKDLPTPEETGIGEKATKVANTSVAEVVAEVRAKKGKRYTSFTDEDRARIGLLFPCRVALESIIFNFYLV